MNQNAKINELESQKIGTLFWKYVLPSIVITTAIALYYVVITIYVGNGPRLGDTALGGLGLVLPIITFMGSIGTLVGVGAASRISLYLGNGDLESARRVMGASITYTILLSIVPILLIYIFLRPFIILLGGIGDVYPFARDFLVFYLPGALTFNLGTTFSNIIKAAGYPKRAMNYMSVGLILSILLAPLFIFVLKWGMKGAALSMSISVTIGFLLFLSHFIDKRTTIRIRRSDLRLTRKLVWDISSIGLAPFIIQATSSISIFFLNNRLSHYGGEIALASYVVANQITLIFIMLISGIAQGMQPIIGYNYGARNYLRVAGTLKYTMWVAGSVGVVGMLFGLFAPGYIVKIVNPSGILAASASKALKIMTITLPFSAFQMVIGAFFQNIGQAAKAVIISLSRQMLLLVPLIFVLPLFFELGGVWISLPLSETVASLLAMIIFISFMRQLRTNIIPKKYEIQPKAEIIKPFMLNNRKTKT